MIEVFYLHCENRTTKLIKFILNEGGDKKVMEGTEFDQITLYACIDLPQ
jgi:hypothetical protein